jgi:CHAT domain-containing protein
MARVRDEETRLRILVVRGMFETNYDAATGRNTWRMVEDLARRRHLYLLASRAIGEQGIAAALLGDISTAKKQVLKAWGVAKTFRDPAGIVRYASIYGEGLVEIVHKYKEALEPLNEAIRLAKSTPGLPYPNMAVTSKVEALTGLGRYSEALALANEAVQYPEQRQLKGGLYQVLETRASVYQHMGHWRDAIADYVRSAQCARDLTYWRGLTEVGGPLARAYEQEGDLRRALATVDEALNANARIPDELYFVPRNLAIKAEIEAKLGQAKLSNNLYEKSADVIDSLLAHAPTPNVERLLIAELAHVYSGYFSSLCNQGNYAAAFGVIEKARGRIEAQALEHHGAVQPHKSTPADERLVQLNRQLINTDEAGDRARILRSIYDTEQQLDTSSLVSQTALHPVPLALLERDLDPSEVIVEYVLSSPNSFVLAITNSSVREYILPAKERIENQANQYRSIVRERKSDMRLAQALFNQLLGNIKEYRQKSRLIVVPDGDLHLLPFSALVDNGQYVLATHSVSTVPSGTVLHILRTRNRQGKTVNALPYVGVAAWTKAADTNIIPRILAVLRWIEPHRSAEGLERSQLIALPASKKEVEDIARDLPKPSMILEGQTATESEFKSLPLDEYNVLHLALHGYADLEYPDRSALVFAPPNNSSSQDDGLLQVREIRQLHLTSSLVTLSACNTGVGPVGEAGIANLGEAFIEAGAQSVVSTLWELADQATAQLMTGFYDRLSHNEDKGDALRDAKLALYHSGLAPYYWASFELVGDPAGNLLTQPRATTISRNIQ